MANDKNCVEGNIEMANIHVRPQNPAVSQQEEAVGNVRNRFVSASLYVGDLERSVTNRQIYDLFQQIAPVVSVRVCRDNVTGSSLGYAYVNYNTVENASRALDQLNFTRLNGKPIRIMYSNRDPSIRKSGSTNIFIKNLGRAIDYKALYNVFSVFGHILSFKIVTDESGRSKGYGFLQFEQEEAAKKAIEKLNGMLINGKHVYVGPFMRKQERKQGNDIAKFNNVFIKNLSESVNDEDLKNYFGEYGTITSAVVMRDVDGKTKCFGFVNFENADDAANSVECLNGKKVDGKEWYVGKAQKKSERESELRGRFQKFRAANLYLKNLDESMDEVKLRELFSPYGTITSCKVMRDFCGQSKCSGFVSFSSQNEAARAVGEMNGKFVGRKPLYVAFAQGKEERRARLQVYFSRLQNTLGMQPALPTYPP